MPRGEEFTVSELEKYPLARAIDELEKAIEKKKISPADAVSFYRGVADKLPKERFIMLTAKIAYYVDEKNIAKELVADAMREILVAPLAKQFKLWFYLIEPIYKHFPEKFDKFVGFIMRGFHTHGPNGLISLVKMINSISGEILEKIADKILTLIDYYPAVFAPGVLLSLATRTGRKDFAELIVEKMKEFKNSHTKKYALQVMEGHVPDELMPLFEDIMNNVEFISDDERIYFRMFIHEKHEPKNDGDIVWWVSGGGTPPARAKNMILYLQRNKADLINAIKKYAFGFPSLALELASSAEDTLSELSDSELEEIVEILHEAYRRILPPLRARYMETLHALYQLIDEQKARAFIEEIIDQLEEFLDPNTLLKVFECILEHYGERGKYIARAIEYLERIDYPYPAEIARLIMKDMRVKDLFPLIRKWRQIFVEGIAPLAYDLYAPFWKPEERIKKMLEDLVALGNPSVNLVVETLGYVTRYNITWDAPQKEIINKLIAALQKVKVADIAFRCIRGVVSGMSNEEFKKFLDTKKYNINFVSVVASVGTEVFHDEEYIKFLRKFLPHLHPSEVLFDIGDIDTRKVMEEIEIYPVEKFHKLLMMLDRCSQWEIQYIAERRYSRPPSQKDITKLIETAKDLSDKTRTVIIDILARKMLEWPPEEAMYLYSLILLFIEEYEPLLAHVLRKRVISVLKKTRFPLYIVIRNIMDELGGE